MCRSRIRGQFCTDLATTTHPGNSSTAVKRAENSLLPVEAAAALVASTVRESILASSEAVQAVRGRSTHLRVLRQSTRGNRKSGLRVSGKTAIATCHDERREPRYIRASQYNHVGSNEDGERHHSQGERGSGVGVLLLRHQFDFVPAR